MFRQSVQRRSVHQSRPYLERLEERCLLTINEFPTPTPNSAPDFITAGPDSNVWFTEYAANKIGQITPGGSIAEFPLLPVSSSANPIGITTSLDGNLWFTDSGTNMIGRIMSDGTHITMFSIPTSNSGPEQIITGPDGNLWFTEYNARKIGQLDPTTGKITEFPASNVGDGTSLAFGPDGNLWFTEFYANMIGRITPDGASVIELPIPTPNSHPVGITAGPDGNIWFTESSANNIARINPYNFSVREFPIAAPNLNHSPQQITTGPDGNLWFTESAGNEIGRITPDGQIKEISVPTSNSGPLSITAGPDGNIWFTERATSKIGQYILTLPASHFQISAASNTTAGTPFGVTVTALDNLNRIVSGYTGTVHFTSSDPQAALPADYSFTAADNGVHTFANAVTLNTSGTQTVTTTDTASGITGSATITVSLPPPPADHFTVSAPSAVVAGSPFDVTVTAITTQGAVATAYTGTVAFTSSDPYPGVLPATYTFTSSDQGVHTFTGGVTLFTAGTQTLTVQDTTHSTITGTATVAVRPSSASGLLITAPSTAVAGTAFNVMVTALDPYDNVATGYTGTVFLTSSDRNPQLSDYTFTASDNGTHSFTLPLFTAGVQTVLARDAANGFLSGTTTVSVQAATPLDFLLTAPSSVVAGSPFDVIVAVLDIYGNTTTNYNGTVHFTTTDSGLGVILPSDYTFTTGSGGDDGVHDFPADFLLITPGLQNLDAADHANSPLGGTQVFVEPSPTPPPPGGGAGLPPSGSGARSQGPSMIADTTPGNQRASDSRGCLGRSGFQHAPQGQPSLYAVLREAF